MPRSRSYWSRCQLSLPAIVVPSCARVPGIRREGYHRSRIRKTPARRQCLARASRFCTRGLYSLAPRNPCRPPSQGDEPRGRRPYRAARYHRGNPPPGSRLLRRTLTRISIPRTSLSLVDAFSTFQGIRAAAVAHVEGPSARTPGVAQLVAFRPRVIGVQHVLMDARNPAPPRNLRQDRGFAAHGRCSKDTPGKG